MQIICLGHRYLQSCSLVATHCPQLLHTVHKCYTLSTTATHCPQLLHTVHNCYTLSTNATHCPSRPQVFPATRSCCYTLSTTATHCPQVLRTVRLGHRYLQLCGLVATHCPQLLPTVHKCYALSVSATGISSYAVWLLHHVPRPD